MKRSLVFLILLLVAALALADQRHWWGGTTGLIESDQDYHYWAGIRGVNETLTAAAPATRRVIIVGP